MAKPPVNFCRNAQAIAGALGLRLLAQRKRRGHQLDAVRALTALPGFPPRQKSGWPRPEVIAWAAANVQLDKKRHEFKVVGPSTANVLSQAEMDSILAKYPTDYQTRFRGLYKKWLAPDSKDERSLTQAEHRELIRVGLVKDELSMSGGAAGPVGIPEYCSHSDFARLLSRLYNVPVYPMRISRAVNEQGMAGKMSNQSIKTSLAIPWWEENVVRKEQPGQGTLFQKASTAELEKVIDDARRSRIEADEAERVASIKWMLKADARATVIGALKLHHVFVKNNCEKHFKAGVIGKLGNQAGGVRDKDSTAQGKAESRNPAFTEEQLIHIATACAATGKEIISAIEQDCENA